jgi:hypothetical protein
VPWKRGNFTLNTVKLSLNLTQPACKWQQVSVLGKMVTTNTLMLVPAWYISINKLHYLVKEQPLNNTRQLSVDNNLSATFKTYQQ